MRIEKFSLRALAIGVLSIVGLVAVATSFVSESQYRRAAIDAQTRTVVRVLTVASDAALSQLAAESGQLASAAVKALSRQPDLNRYLAEAPAGTSNPVLSNLLDAPLNTRLTVVKPVSVRLYNSARQLLMTRGIDEAENSPALATKNPESTAPSSWLAEAGPRYSIVKAIGDSSSPGFLEIRFDLVSSLGTVAELTHLPLRIKSPYGDVLFETGDWEAQPETAHEIIHPIRGNDGIPVVELAVLDDFAEVYKATHQTRNTTSLVIVALIGIALMIAILILDRFLFRPLRSMIDDMNRVAQGDTTTQVSGRALKEFHALANAFNAMTQQIKDIIEREQQAAEDVKGKVELIQEVVAMAAKGDLTGQVMVYRDQDIISELAAGIQSMLDSLNSLVARIQQSGVQVTSSATEIAATAKEQEATANETAATTNQIKATVTEITATSKELVNTMSEVTEVAWKTSESANAGRSSLQRMESTMHQMSEATASIGSKLAVLSEKAGNINTVVTTINRVADQTNLLSLNAAIEAEKAGEYGVGFAVVATEIRRLADQTAVATWDIEQMVKEMQSAVSAGVMGMEKFSEEVRHGVDDVRQVGAQLAVIIEQVETLIPRFEEVNEGMSSQAQGGNQIRDAIVQLSESAQQTADSLRQSNGAIMQLNDAAKRLQEGASHFRVSS